MLGHICVARRQNGHAVCYVPPDSRTPRRYECQPDLVVKAVEATFRERTGPRREAERLRVEPGLIAYWHPPAGCDACAGTSAARTLNRMGVFHDLYPCGTPICAPAWMNTLLPG